MATDLFTPVLNDRTRSVRFFNGRLLSGEAMTDEQSGLRAARMLLAQAVGDGVAQGFTVKESVGVSTTLSPVVTVGAGVAINRRGEILLLATDTDVKLVRPAQPATTVAPVSVFQTCTPPTQGVYVADAGVYLLTVCSLGAANGLAEVSGLGGIQASCNAKYIVDAVQLRLLEVPVDAATLADVAHLRNRVAYQCFGVDHLLDFATDPLGTTAEPRTLLDALRDTKQLTDCDVPLALIYWTATGGIHFLDMWSVRRRVTRTNAPASLAALSDVRLAAAEAMVLQFQEQIATLRGSGVNLAGLVAMDSFTRLPPIGILPTAGGSANGFQYSTFFNGVKVGGPAFIEGARYDELCREAMRYPPIRIADQELVRMYVLRENRQSIDGGSLATLPALVFVNGHVPDRSGPHYDLAYWNYATYA
jgi:hypothetical protein